MSHHVARRMASLSEGLSKELDSLADRAFEVAKHAKQLEEQHGRAQASVGVQCSLAAAEPAYHLDRSQRLKPFEFQPLGKKQIDARTWQKIRAVNVDKLVGENDARPLMDFFSEIATADLEADSGYNLTTANLIKLCQVCQLMLQWQQWEVEQGHEAVFAMSEQRDAQLAAISLIPSMNIKDVDSGLRGLGRDFVKVGETDLDLMFQKARAEERAGRTDVRKTDQGCNTHEWISSHPAAQPPSMPPSEIGPLPSTMPPSQPHSLPPSMPYPTPLPSAEPSEHPSSLTGMVRQNEQQQQPQQAETGACTKLLANCAPAQMPPQPQPEQQGGRCTNLIANFAPAQMPPQQQVNAQAAQQPQHINTQVAQQQQQPAQQQQQAAETGGRCTNIASTFAPTPMPPQQPKPQQEAGCKGLLSTCMPAQMPPQATPQTTAAPQQQQQQPLPNQRYASFTGASQPQGVAGSFTQPQQQPLQPMASQGSAQFPPQRRPSPQPSVPSFSQPMSVTSQFSQPPAPVAPFSQGMNTQSPYTQPPTSLASFSQITQPPASVAPYAQPMSMSSQGMAAGAQMQRYPTAGSFSQPQMMQQPPTLQQPYMQQQSFTQPGSYPNSRSASPAAQRQAAAPMPGFGPLHRAREASLTSYAQLPR